MRDAELHCLQNRTVSSYLGIYSRYRSFRRLKLIKFPPLMLNRRNIMTKPYVRLDKDNAAVLLVDHQAGLLSLVRDIEPEKFKNNVLALADLAKYFALPTILTPVLNRAPMARWCLS